ncbi:MAG TPA: caspase family protein [Longimicrobiaceae bacterium]|jgi:hypothetical protein|nr:caspase family protein [Longimicrobiaceae bacterium]
MMQPRFRHVLAALVLAASVHAGAVHAQHARKAAAKSTVMRAVGRAAPVGEVRAGTSVNGTLAPGDSVLSDTSYLDVWSYRGRAGERVTITLSSKAYDTYLHLDLPPGGAALATDDDSGGGTNSRIVIRLLQDGVYSIAVNSVRPRQTGPYTLSVEATRNTQVGAAGEDWAAIYPGGGDPNERYAVLVGMENYPTRADHLDGPATDARLMRDLLVEKYGFRPENVVMLQDSAGNRERVIQAVQRHLGQAGPRGVAVFYYSGHGTQLDGNFGQQDDEPDGKDEAIVLWGGSDRVSLLLDDELGSLSDRLPAGRALFILDSCHSGTALRGGAETANPANKFLSMARLRGQLQMPRSFLPAAARGEAAVSLDPPGRGQRKRVFIAAAADQESAWGVSEPWPAGTNESVFTHYLVEELRRSDASETFQQAARVTLGATTRYTKQHHGKPQTPRAEGEHVAEPIADFLAKR